MDPDMDWTPPSEAEMKVIQAKRERADKISSLMGSYLLKGYKMLNETCPKCSTILLRDKQEELYCVACVEVDADTEKDNPASSAEAARRLVAESQFCSPAASRSPPPPPEPPAPAVVEPAPAPAASVRPRTQPPPPVSVPPPPSCNGPTLEGAADGAALTAAAAAVRRRLAWAGEQLDGSTAVEGSLQLLRLVRECAETLLTLRRAGEQESRH